MADLGPPRRSRPTPGLRALTALLVALVAAGVTAAAQPTRALPSDPDELRRELEDLIYRGATQEAASRADRLLRDRHTLPAHRRIGRYIHAHVLLENFRASLADPRVAEEVARQTERAWLALVKQGGRDPVDLKARFLLGLFYQDQARWRLGRNEVLYASEIAHDLTQSNRVFVELAGLIPADTPHRELAGLRSWAQAHVPINFFYLARIHAPGTDRRTYYLSQALSRLEKVAEAYPGLPAGNRAYFYLGLAWLLYGRGSEPADNEARQKAREIFLDLWKSIPWTRATASFKEEVIWQLCRLDTSTGHPGRVLVAVTLLKQRLDATDQAPSRFTVQALGVAALARSAVHDARAVADGLEADLAWLENRAGPGAARRLLSVAVQLAPELRGSVDPASHPRVMLLAARGWNQAGEPRRALAWIARLVSSRTLPSDLKNAAWLAASRSWEALGFLREALVALDQAIRQEPGLPTLDGGDPCELQRRAAVIWQRLARNSGTARDWRQLEARRAHLPGEAGRTAYETGMRIYSRGELGEALEWFQRVSADTHYHALALAMQAHILYRQWRARGARAGEEVEALQALRAGDRLTPRAPNWIPAQSLRYLTRAMLRKTLGDTAGALADLEGFETKFKDQPQLVREALKARLALHLELNRADRARSDLAELTERFPRDRATGEACLLLGRYLRRTPTIEAALRRESLRLRQVAAEILGAAFPVRDRYLLAVDEMDQGAWASALGRLNALARDHAASLRSARDGLDLRRARCLMALDRLEPAEEILADLRQRKPDHLEPLRWTAYLRGGTLEPRGDALVERRYLDRPRDAFPLWERIKDHAERSTPFGPLWFEAQFHMALLNYWNGHPERVRAIIRWIRVSGYDPCGDHPSAVHFRWLLERLDRDGAAGPGPGENGR